MITFPPPMQAPEALRAPFTDPEWLYEIKFDGYRCMARIEPEDNGAREDPNRVQLRKKVLRDLLAQLPEKVRKSVVLYVDHLPASEPLFQQMVALQEAGGLGLLIEVKRSGWQEGRRWTKLSSG